MPPVPGSGGEIPVPGVRPLDHTADVGIEVEAENLSELLRRAARGMTHLLLDAPPSSRTLERSIRVSGDGPSGLLRNWLREVLYYFDAEGLAFVDAIFSGLSEEGLEATLQVGLPDRAPAREIKGVTLHELMAERRQDGSWYARVIFDV